MKKIRVLFLVSTRYVGSEVGEEVEIEVPENTTERELASIISEEYEYWLSDNTNQSWSIIEDNS